MKCRGCGGQDIKQPEFYVAPSSILTEEARQPFGRARLVSVVAHKWLIYSLLARLRCGFLDTASCVYC